MFNGAPEIIKFIFIFIKQQMGNNAHKRTFILPERINNHTIFP